MEYKDFLEIVRHDYLASKSNLQLGHHIKIWNNNKKEFCHTIRYDYAYAFVNGFARVNLNSKWCFIDETGKEICDVKYDHVENFVNGFAKIEITRIKPDPYNHNYGDVIDHTFGFINEQGKEICEIKYSKIFDFHDGFAKGELSDSGYGFINEQGKEVCKYSYIGNVVNGFARVSLYNRWGYINKNFEEICPIQFDEVSDFQDEFAVTLLFCHSTTAYIINTKGEIFDKVVYYYG